MQTSVEFDDAFMAEAMRAAGATDERAAIREAMRRMVAIWRQRELLDLRGIGWDGDLDDMRTSKHAGETW